MLMLASIALLSILAIATNLPAELGWLAAVLTLQAHVMVCWAGYESRAENFAERIWWFMGLVFVFLHYIPHIGFYQSVFGNLWGEMRVPALWVIWFVTPLMLVIAPFMQYRLDGVRGNLGRLRVWGQKRRGFWSGG